MIPTSCCGASSAFGFFGSDVPVFEEGLIKNIHPLPCDQRYDVDDMDNICKLLLEFDN